MYTVAEEDGTMGDERTMRCMDDVSHRCTRGAYIML